MIPRLAVSGKTSPFPHPSHPDFSFLDESALDDLSKMNPSKE